MRQKQLRLILTFSTTTAAMSMEQACRTAGAPGRLIPVPREITAGCGMAWSAPPETRELLSRIAQEAGISFSGVYEQMI